MTTEGETSVEERILQVLQYLGIEKAHFAASNPSDWQGMVTSHPECVASLTLVTPRSIEPSFLRPLGPRLLVFNGDHGNSAEALERSLESLPDATLVALPDYVRSNMADTIADRRDSIGLSFLNFLGRMDQVHKARAASLSEDEGEVAGITYRIRGSGPPLVLLPIEYAPSQWEPLLPTLAQHHCTVTLGGSWLGVVALLEERAKDGYLEAVSRVIDETRLQPGDRVLDVGCGPGSIDRWLAHRTGGANPIVGVDISPHLIREAAALVRSEGLEGVIEFQEARAEALPFPDHSFDVSMSFTVINVADADRMLAEMIRVTKPEGRIAVLANGNDRPRIINLPLRDELKAKVEAPPGGFSNPQGCADASLYRRFHQVGLTHVKMFPQLATESNRSRLRFLESDIFSALSLKEREEWRTAVAEAEKEGTFFISVPYHCAVGTKP